MKSCCNEYNCIKCCLETRMPLLDQDVQRIRALGFETDFFVIKRSGWLQLKNKDGRCVFHNGKICLIYKDRPHGCRLYPVIYDADERCAIFDKDCPHKDKFEISENAVKELHRVVLQLECERSERKRKDK